MPDNGTDRFCGHGKLAGLNREADIAIMEEPGATGNENSRVRGGFGIFARAASREGSRSIAPAIVKAHDPAAVSQFLMP